MAARRGVPGAHVILSIRGARPALESLTFAARLAARNSKAHAAGGSRWTTRAAGTCARLRGAFALVTYSGEKTIAVATE